MTKRNLIRSSHTGKSPDDVEAYKKFLRDRKTPEKTVEDPQKLYKTDASSLEEDEIKTGKIQRKSTKLKITDWMKEHLIAIIISSIMIPIIFTAFSWAWKTSLNMSLQSKQLEDIEDDIDSINLNITSIQDKNSTFEIFKIEIKKDIEFIKKKIIF